MNYTEQKNNTHCDNGSSNNNICSSTSSSSINNLNNNKNISYNSNIGGSSNNNNISSIVNTNILLDDKPSAELYEGGREREPFSSSFGVDITSEEGGGKREKVKHQMDGGRLHLREMKFFFFLSFHPLCQSRLSFEEGS